MKGKIMPTANSLRVNELEKRWLGQRITNITSNYWLEHLDLVKDSPTLTGSVRKEFFLDLGTALHYEGYAESDIPKEEKEVLRDAWASHEPPRETFFEVVRFILHGCEAALNTNFDPKTNTKIEKLLEILERKAAEELV